MNEIGTLINKVMEAISYNIRNSWDGFDDLQTSIDLINSKINILIGSIIALTIITLIGFLATHSKTKQIDKIIEEIEDTQYENLKNKSQENKSE